MTTDNPVRELARDHRGGNVHRNPLPQPIHPQFADCGAVSYSASPYCAMPDRVMVALWNAAGRLISSEIYHV